MKKKKSWIRFSFLCVLVFCFIFFPVLANEVHAGEGWKSLFFEPGQSFTYLIRAEKDGVETLGEVSIFVYPAGGEMIEINLQLEFDGEYFEVYAEGDRNDIEDLYVNLLVSMMWEIPELAMQLMMHTFLQPWVETPLQDAELSLDWVWEEDEDWDDWEDEDLFIGVVGEATYGGFDGFVIRAEEDVDLDFVFEVCINPTLPLPIMGRASNFVPGTEFEGGSLYAELINYEIVSFAEVDLEEKRKTEATILDELVEYWAEHSLEIGERTMKAYGMLGAVAGFGLMVEGDEIEVYLFDPETAYEKTLEYLYEARETGKFVFEEMGGMEIPVVINGYIMLTGLEYGTFYKHPEKDLIVEIFNSF